MGSLKLIYFLVYEYYTDYIYGTFKKFGLLVLKTIYYRFHMPTNIKVLARAHCLILATKHQTCTLIRAGVQIKRNWSAQFKGQTIKCL
jgi:hypothetical protein